MANEAPTNINSIKMSSGDEIAVCHNNANNAKEHVITPNVGIYLLLAVFTCTFKLEAFTAAKIIKNPALPMVAILDISKILAMIKVSTDVINNPLIGRFHIFFLIQLVIPHLLRLYS